MSEHLLSHHSLKMHRKSRRDRTSLRRRIIDVAITLLSAVAVFVLLIETNRHGIASKWVTAIVATISPFALVTYAFRSRFSRWSLWIALFLCLAFHSLIFFVVFQYVLSAFQWVSIWLLLPVMIGEAFVLLIAVKRIEEALSGRKGTIRLDV